MAKLIGNIRPEDDYTHPLGPEPNFNESVYFNFFDPSQNRGGFVRIGNRANEGYAEMTVIVWNPDSSAFFYYAKPEISSNDGWNAGGLEVQVLEPAEKVRTIYEGKALYLANPEDMQNPSRAFKDNPRKPLRIDLTHFAAGPMYGHVGEPGDGNDFARAHTEQHMKVQGTLKLDEDEINFSGWGLRDHSWGPRFWQSTPGYRWITGNFGDDLGMVLTTGTDGVGRGVFHVGEELVKVEHVLLTPSYEDGTGFHRALSAELTMEDGAKRHLDGQVMGYIPLRNRRDGSITRVGEGMTEYTLDGERTGYGLSEFLDQTAMAAD